MRDPILGYDIVLDEFLHLRGSDCFVGSYFHPLREVVNGHQDIATIGGNWMDGFDDVNSPSRERPCRGHVVQLLRGSVDEVPMDLAIMTSASELTATYFHG